MDKYVEKFHFPLLIILGTGPHFRKLARLIKCVIKGRKEVVACIMYKPKNWTAQLL